ncbi:MAG: hypothetical protein JSW27_05870, partial [Phycisphaerales bacterium]
ILASPLAFDYLRTVLLLLLTLVLLAGLGNLVNRMADWPHTPHHRHALGHKLHKFISYWHH